MSNEVEQVFRSVFAAVRAFYDQPHIKEYYRKEAEKEAKKRRAEERAAQLLREAAESERARARSYDAYVLNGGGDECIRFGINDGCHPECPVFQRGECEMQAENEAIFAEQSDD